MNGVAEQAGLEECARTPRELLGALQTARLVEALSRAVTRREEGFALAEHLAARTRRRVVVLARAEFGWRVIGAIGIDCDREAEVERDPSGWLSARAPGDWQGHDLCHGRRVVGQVWLDGDTDDLEPALRAAAPFLAARRSRATDAQAQLGLHVSQISHDMRQPLSVITLSIDLLDDVPQARPILDRIRRARRELTEFLEDLLAFAASPAVQRVELPLAPLTKDLLEDVRERAELAAIDLALEVRARPCVLGDARRLERAIGNLLSNALEVSPPGSRVRVTLDADDGAAILEVHDAGPGVPPALREKVFEPFFTTRAKGTGLGLAVVRQVVRVHGGEVAFVDGPGGVVRIRLPLAHR